MFGRIPGAVYLGVSGTLHGLSPGVRDMCFSCMGGAIRMFAELMFGRLPEVVDVPCLAGHISFV